MLFVGGKVQFFESAIVITLFKQSIRPFKTVRGLSHSVPSSNDHCSFIVAPNRLGVFTLNRLRLRALLTEDILSTGCPNFGFQDKGMTQKKYIGVVMVWYGINAHT